VILATPKKCPKFGIFGSKPNVNKLRIKRDKKEADYKPGGNKMLKKTYHSGKEQRK